MLAELINWHTIDFIHLHALDKEKTGLDADRLGQRQLVAPIVDLGNQVFHLVRVERSHTNEHLVQHHTNGPSVDFLRVASLFQ